MVVKACLVVAALATAITIGAPPVEVEQKPMPYEYDYKVEDANYSVYYGAQEKGNEAGRVDGFYYVWLPDRRLMKVSYFVEGESGFVSKITFSENVDPFRPTKK